MLNTKLLLLLVACLGLASVECGRRRNRINFKIEERTVKQPLTRKSNVFLADITLGSPPQQFQVALDTEKTAFWVMSSSCESDLCKTSKLFKSSESKSFVDGNDNETTIVYRDLTTVEGEMASDVLVLGNLVIENQEFILADNVTLDGDEPYDGLLGVAYSDDEEDEEENTPLENLAESEVSKNIFSFIVSGKKGTLVLGDIDSSINKKSIQYVSLNNNGDWNFEVSKVSISGKRPFLLYPSGANFSIDTTISFIGVPEDYLSVIGENLKAEYIEEDESYVVNCGLRKSSKDIEFEVNGKTFRIPPSLYISYDKDTELCSLNMKPVPQDYWVWGTPILESFYVVFDAEEDRIGFAKYPKSN